MQTETDISVQPLETEDTRDRILIAARKLFAEKGFDATSVRDITAGAGANVAAVNYHFGGKEKLYLEVFRRLLREHREQRIGRIRSDLQGAGGGATLELFIESFARSFLESLLEDGRGDRLMAFMDREMHHLRLPPEVFLDELIRPMVKFTLDALGKVGPRLEPTVGRMCMLSLVGQVIHAGKMGRMFGDREDISDVIPNDFEAMIRHIVRFTAAGINASAQEAV